MEPLTWETTSSNIDYKCDRFNVRQDEVVLPNGNNTNYHYVEEPPGVVILPFTTTDDVINIEEWRQAVGRVNRGLPAGSVESNEDIQMAARRELKEETGYKVGSINHLQTIEPSNGVTNALHHHFVATDCELSAEQKLDQNESIRVRTDNYDTILTAVLDGRIQDGRTITCVIRYELAKYVK